MKPRTAGLMKKAKESLEAAARDTLKWAAEFIAAGTKVFEAKPNN